jgi:hypothetical protein
MPTSYDQGITPRNETELLYAAFDQDAKKLNVNSTLDANSTANLATESSSSNTVLAIGTLVNELKEINLQFKLFNIRFEEAFKTGIDEEDLR